MNYKARIWRLDIELPEQVMEIDFQAADDYEADDKMGKECKHWSLPDGNYAVEVESETEEECFSFYLKVAKE